MLTPSPQQKPVIIACKAVSDCEPVAAVDLELVQKLSRSVLGA
jgi:hypothetical protein